MTLNELLITDLSGKDIIVIGKPASGKTHVASLIAKRYGQHLVSTDHYAFGDYEQALYDLVDDLQPRTCPVVVEGVLCYRLLRKGLQSPEIGFQPKAVVMLEISTKQQHEIYRKERDPRKLQYMRAFDVGNQKVLNDYYRLLETAEFKPEILTVENTY